jgi:hypothetical protein
VGATTALVALALWAAAELRSRTQRRTPQLAHNAR